MDIKITIGFGRKGQHSARARNLELETQVGALTEALKKSNGENKELREQLAEALSDRIKKGRQMNSIGLQAAKLVEIGPSRFKVTGQE